jgi:hypothetical protein
VASGPLIVLTDVEQVVLRPSLVELIGLHAVDSER